MIPDHPRFRWLMPLLAFALFATPGWAEEDDDREVSAESAPRPADMPLAPLPELPSLELPRPRPRAVQAIDDILSRLISRDPVVVQRAAREVFEAKSDWVSGISRKIDAVADRADRSAMKQLLESTCSDARKDLPSEDASPDYLTLVLERSQPESSAYVDLVQLLGLVRMLRAIESTAASRELIRVYVRFGEFMRIDVQRQLEELGDRATAALIEAQRHPAQKVARWAERLLDLKGRAIAHEAVRTEDPNALADILLALGRTRDPDATRILISFAGTDRSQIRTAARQGIVALGEVASWQLRDAYQDTTGRTPPRAWTWKRTARELFTEFDRMRLSEVYALLETAEAARKAGKLSEMRRGYDEILTRSPLFDQRGRMAEGYLEFAHSSDVAPEDALLAARRVLRISEDEAQRKKAQSLIQTLTAERLRAEGLFDRAILDEAIRLDPNNQPARLRRSSGGRESTTTVTLSPFTRYAAALLVSALALGGAAWILWSSRGRAHKTPTVPFRHPSTPEQEPTLDFGTRGSRPEQGEGSEPRDAAPESKPES